MSILDIAKNFNDSDTIVYLSIPEINITFQTRILRVADDVIVLENTIPIEHIDAATESKEFYLQLGMTKLDSDTIASDGINILFPFNTMTEIKETRGAERFSFHKDEKVICRLLNPLDNTTWIERPLVDMSDSGLSIACTNTSPLFCAGRTFDRIEILLDGDPYTKTKGKVVYSRPVIDLAGQLFVQVGFATL